MITHKEKIRIARAMPRTAEDNDYKRGLFDTAAWENRKNAIAARVHRREILSMEKAASRRNTATPGVMTRARMRVMAALERRRQEKKRRNDSWARRHVKL